MAPKPEPMIMEHGIKVRQNLAIVVQTSTLVAILVFVVPASMRVGAAEQQIANNSDDIQRLTAAAETLHETVTTLTVLVNNVAARQEDRGREFEAINDRLRALEGRK